MPISEEARKRLEKRVQAQKAADAIYELMIESVDGYVDLYWEFLDRHIQKHLVINQIPASAPMTEIQATHFGNTAMPFGKYSGRPIGDVPLLYLDWLIKSGEEETFKSNLRRYLQSDIIVKKAQEEDPDKE